jgi:hypothetical protein
MGQNRYKYVTTALLYSVFKSNYVDVIDQKYLEAGHTQMECDSMHAAIEYAKRKTNVFIPSQWDTIIHMTRRSNLYIVLPLKYWDFIYFKKMQNDFFKNFETNTSNEKVRWREIRHLQFRKSFPQNIYYKYDFSEADFKVIKCIVQTRGRQMQNIELPKKYKRRLEISCAKKADLLSLCNSGVIPEDLHHFYKLIPTNKTIRDC